MAQHRLQSSGTRRLRRRVHVRSGPRRSATATADAARGNLPPDRPHPRQPVPPVLHGDRGWIHFRHVRHRRRLPDDAAAHLHRHFARRRGRERREPHQRVVLMPPLPSLPVSPPAGAVASVASHISASSFSGVIAYWRRSAIDLALALMLLCGGIIGTMAGVWLFSFLRSVGQLDITIGLSYVTLLSIVGGMM